jgi:hypothetical protein
VFFAAASSTVVVPHQSRRNIPHDLADADWVRIMTAAVFIENHSKALRLKLPRLSVLWNRRYPQKSFDISQGNESSPSRIIGEALIGTRTLADFRFASISNQASAFVPLNLQSMAAI